MKTQAQLDTRAYSCNILKFRTRFNNKKKTLSWSYLKYCIYWILYMLETMILWHSLYQVILEFPCRNDIDDQKYKTHSRRFLCHYDDVILPVAHVTNMDYFNTSWTSNYMQIHHKVLDEITCSFSNCCGVTVEVWKTISNFFQHFTGYMITYPC